MKNNKLRVGLICGGTSCEHEISLLTVKNVLQAMNPEKYDLVPIYIDKRGMWHHFEPQMLLEISTKELLENRESVALTTCTNSSTSSVRLPDAKLDVVFPLLHGPN